MIKVDVVFEVQVYVCFEMKFFILASRQDLLSRSST